MALLYQAEARYEQASPLLHEVLNVGRRVLGEQHPDTLATLNNVAELYRRQNKYEEAESIFHQLLAVRRRSLAPDHPNITNVLASIGGIKVDQQRYAEAEPFLREAVERQRRASPDSWRRYYTESLLGVCLSGLSKYEEAEQILLFGYAGMRARRDSMPYENRELLDEIKSSISRIYQTWGKPSPAL